MLVSTLLNIWILYAAAMLTPGANTLLVCHIAVADHKQKAIAVAFGIAIGSAIWAILAILGIDLLFQTLPWLRTILQILGAFYLLYVAIRVWQTGSSGDMHNMPRAPSKRKAFQLGILTNMTNPQGAIFFGSIFAASFAPHTDWITKLAAIIMIFSTSILWHVGLAYVFSHTKIQARYLNKRQFLSSSAALIIASMAFYLLWNVIKNIPTLSS